MFDWKSLATSVVIAYVVSWVLFFIALPFISSILGKIVGSIITYALSWTIFVIIIGIAERDMLARLSQMFAFAKNIIGR
jgi:protein-S-isoprenylcysteine O-methyltransferase Ste14